MGDRYADPQIQAGKRRILVLIDPEQRPVRMMIEIRDGERWQTESFSRWAFDEPVDRALFQPRFGSDVRIVDADTVFDEFIDLKSAVHVEQRAGLIYAIHRVQRFENGGVFVVSSVRGTDETLKQYPLTTRQVRPGVFVVDGPAVSYRASPQFGNFLRLELAEATHRGIDVCWWAMIPCGRAPARFDVAPGRIRITAGITPCGAYAKALHSDEHGVIQHMTWDIELDVPQQDTLPSVDQIAKEVFADQRTLQSIPTKWLNIGTYREGKLTTVEDISDIDYAKSVAKMFQSWIEAN